MFIKNSQILSTKFYKNVNLYLNSNKTIKKESISSLFLKQNNNKNNNKNNIYNNSNCNYNLIRMFATKDSSTKGKGSAPTPAAAGSTPTPAAAGSTPTPAAGSATKEELNIDFPNSKFNFKDFLKKAELNKEFQEIKSLKEKFEEEMNDELLAEELFGESSTLTEIEKTKKITEYKQKKKEELMDQNDINSRIQQEKNKQLKIEFFQKTKDNIQQEEQKLVVERVKNLIFRERSLMIRAKNLKLNDLSDPSKKWQIIAALIIERYPRVFKIEPWMEEYNQFQLKKNNEIAIKTPLDDIISAIKPNWKEISAKEKRAMEIFKPAPLRTSDDQSGNKKSLNRKLEEKLFLITKRPREQFAWQFPHTPWIQGETLRQSAERALDNYFESDLFIQFLSNSPAGHHIYEYPNLYQKKTGFDGAKVFFYRVEYISGGVHLKTKKYNDHLWVSKSELNDYFALEQSKYFQKLLY
eukprot:TRINITY_DN190_c0_g2_i1.p1 TRINITY_DN190_c0_g2~~TRINITY_DN190_c0_g2_i1.p1  ORF type:complete len:467 (+),score=217.85 TRINITY_DN190_c0_g2_i1:156-1556(+)